MDYVRDCRRLVRMESIFQFDARRNSTVQDHTVDGRAGAPGSYYMTRGSTSIPEYTLPETGKSRYSLLGGIPLHVCSRYSLLCPKLYLLAIHDVEA